MSYTLRTICMFFLHNFNHRTFVVTLKVNSLEYKKIVLLFKWKLLNTTYSLMLGYYSYCFSTLSSKFKSKLYKNTFCLLIGLVWLHFFKKENLSREHFEEMLVRDNYCDIYDNLLANIFNKMVNRYTSVLLVM